MHRMIVIFVGIVILVLLVLTFTTRYMMRSPVELYNKIFGVNEESDSHQSTVCDILECIKDRDVAFIDRCFAESAILEIGKDTFNDMANELFQYCTFDHIINCYKRTGSKGEGSLRDGKKRWVAFESYDVETNTGMYRCCVKFVDADQFETRNEGVWSFYIIKYEDHLKPEHIYHGDGKFTTGLWFDIQ